MNVLRAGFAAQFEDRGLELSARAGGGRRGLVSARLACESIEPLIQRGEQFLHHGIGPDVESVERHSKVRQSIALMEAISFEA